MWQEVGVEGWGGFAFNRGAAACNSLNPTQPATALKTEKCFS